MSIFGMSTRDSQTELCPSYGSGRNVGNLLAVSTLTGNSVTGTRLFEVGVVNVKVTGSSVPLSETAFYTNKEKNTRENRYNPSSDISLGRRASGLLQKKSLRQQQPPVHLSAKRDTNELGVFQSTMTVQTGV